MPGNPANLGFWTAPPKRLSQAGDWFYPGEIAKAGVNVEKKAQRDKFHQKFVPFFQVDGTPYCPVRYYRIKQGHKPNHHLRGKGTNMNRMLYSDMLKDINRARESGGNVAACIDSFREIYKYVYAYKDSCFKKIFGAIASTNMAASFLNAILKIDRPNCISTLDFTLGVEGKVHGRPQGNGSFTAQPGRTDFCNFGSIRPFGAGNPRPNVRRSQTVLMQEARFREPLVYILTADCAYCS